MSKEDDYKKALQAIDLILTDFNDIFLPQERRPSENWQREEEFLGKILDELAILNVYGDRQ